MPDDSVVSIVAAAVLAAAVPGPRRSPRPKQACTKAALLGGGSRLVYGGAGNKILAAAIGDVDAVIQHKFGGPWDTCAPEAVLAAMGGQLTDLCGDPLSVYEGGPSEGGPLEGPWALPRGPFNLKNKAH